MAASKSSLEAINNFLAKRRIALIGISHDPKDFSIMLFEELCCRSYDVMPVNPNLSEVQGAPCFARVQDIQPPVEAAILMTSPAVTEAVVRECAEAGIKHLWMYRAGGKGETGGAVSASAIKFCQEHGIDVIPGECPYMFLPNVGFGHRVHGFIRKITGHYPQRQAV